MLLLALRVEELSAADGVELLARLAPDAVAQDSAAAADLVGLVGGLPLALTLIGHRLRIEAVEGRFQLPEVLTRLRVANERLKLTRWEAAAAAHPSLTSGVPVSLLATLDVSYRRLTDAARTALCDLAAFPPKPDTFAVSAARTVTPDETALGALVRALDWWSPCWTTGMRCIR